GGQALQQVVAHVDAEGIHASGLQGLQHGLPGLEGYRTLGTLAAEQHGDTAEGRYRHLAAQPAQQVLAHFASPWRAANSGLCSSCGARPPMSPAPWHNRMSPARSSGLTSGAKSTPRSI